MVLFMDRIFFAIIGLAFGFAVLQTFNHQMLSSNSPIVEQQEKDIVDGYKITGEISKITGDFSRKPLF